jgi:ketosteroid isomerase-like protein
MIVDQQRDPDGVASGPLRLTAMPGGKASVEFLLSRTAASSATFSNPAHDAPTAITYARQGDLLTAVLDGPSGDPDVAQTYRFRPFAAAPAPALEQADRDFASDTKKRGADGWLAAFDRDGAMWGARRGRITGAAIRDAMADTFEDVSIEWEPKASRMSPAGDLGFTVGFATYRDRKSQQPVGYGRYVTIWRKQPDGSWKVLFDTGRPVDGP